MASKPTQSEVEQAERDANESLGHGAVTQDMLAKALIAIGQRATRDEETAKIPQVPLAKYKAQTPWHPTGSPDRPSFRRITRLNGFRLKESRQSNEEIKLFNELKPGRYCGGKWIVTSTDDDEGSAINLYLPNKTEDDRITRARECPNGLIDALKKIIAEQRQPVAA